MTGVQRAELLATVGIARHPANNAARKFHFHCRRGMAMLRRGIAARRFDDACRGVDAGLAMSAIEARRRSHFGDDGAPDRNFTATTGGTTSTICAACHLSCFFEPKHALKCLAIRSALKARRRHG